MKLPKKQKQRSMKAIETELWALCRSICHLRDAKWDNTVDCYTCPQKSIVGQNRQLGHGYAKGALSASLKYDIRILRYQCYNCNINLGGMGAVFWKNLERDLGKKEADALFKECNLSKGRPVNARNHYLDLIPKYKKIMESF